MVAFYDIPAYGGRYVPLSSKLNLEASLQGFRGTFERSTQGLASKEADFEAVINWRD